MCFLYDDDRYHCGRADEKRFIPWRTSAIFGGADPLCYKNAPNGTGTVLELPQYNREVHGKLQTFMYVIPLTLFR
jgi:hypothetical protein